MSRFRLLLSTGLVLGTIVGVQQAVANVPGPDAGFTHARLATACTSAGRNVVGLNNGSAVPVVFVLRAKGWESSVSVASHSRSKVRVPAVARRISCAATAA